MSDQKKYGSIFKPKTQRMALEPRIVFDAAIPVAIADNTHVAADNTASPVPLTLSSRESTHTGQSDDSVEFFSADSDAKQLVFIDAGVVDKASILNQFPNSEVIVLDANQDGLLQVADVLAGRTDVDAIHIFSHGSDGELELGNSSLNTASLTQDYSDAMAQIRQALSADADILLYGCDVAGSDKGEAFVRALAAETGADIAASTDLTGENALGGDWDLEFKQGNIETRAAAIDNFSGVLAAPLITDDEEAEDRITDEDTPLAITGVSVNDDDVGVTLQAAITATGGTITLAGAGWTVTAGADGSGSVTITGTQAQINAALNGMSFDPDADMNADSAGYTPLIDIAVSDLDTPDGPTNIQISNIAVTAINDAPVIAGGTPLEVDEGGTTNFSAAAIVGLGFTQAELGLSDIDTTEVQTIVKIAGVPSNGNLRLNGNLIAEGSTFAVSDIANLSYEHDGSQVISATSDSFFITVDDGAGGLITNQQIDVNISPINQAPTLEGVITLIEGEQGVNLADNGLLIAPFNSPRGSITFTDPEAGAPQSYEITGLPGNGALFYDGVEITAATPGAPFLVANPNLLTYNHNGGENFADSFTMRATDDGGGEGNILADTATIQLDIVPNNDDPILAANNPQLMLSGSTSITLTNAMLAVTDVDSATTTLTYTLSSVPDPLEGYFTLNGQTLTAGATFTQSDINSGGIVYTTLSNTPRTDSITFTVQDGGVRLYPDSREGGIYDNDSQASPLTPITFSITVPNDVVPSTDSLPGNAPVNTTPTTGGANAINENDLNEGGTFVLSATELLSIDTESSADELIYRLISLPTSGDIQLNGNALTYNQTFTQEQINNGEVSFVHASGEDFVDSFDYSVSDGSTESASQVFSIDITPQNDTPTASTNGAIFVREDEAVAITSSHIGLSDNDNSASDKEGSEHAINDALSFRITGDTTHGELRLESVLITANTTVVTLLQLQNGDLTYTHLGSENYSDSFSIVPLDDSGIAIPMATNESSEGSTLIVPITIFPINDSPIFASKWQLIAAEAGAVTEGGTRVIGGAESYATINGVAGSGLPTPESDTNVAHLVFGDDDNSSVQRQYRITTATVNGKIMRNGAALGVGSVFTQADMDAGLITYEHDGSETFTDAFDYVVSDGDWTANDVSVFAQGVAPTSSTFLIEITARNDIAEITGPSDMDAFAAASATNAVPVITLADLDLDDGVTAGETDFMRVEVSVLDGLDNPVAAALLNYGVTPDPSSFVSGKDTDSLILQGTKAEIDAILASLTVALSSDLDADDYTIRVVADDRLYDNAGVLTADANGGGPVNDDGSTIDAANNRVSLDIDLRVSNFNDLPVITNATSFSVNEDSQITLGGFALSDDDSFGENVTATIRLYNDAGRTVLANSNNEGRLRLAGQPGVDITGTNSNTITITGSLADVENALNVLIFQGRGDFNGAGIGAGTLYLRTEIADYTHADGQKTATVDNDITITPVNDAPVLGLNTVLQNSLTMDSGTSISINAEGGSFTLNDNRDTSEGAPDLISVTVAATNTVGGAAYGTLTAAAAGSATINNDNTDTITITGISADVQNTLNSLVYSPTDANVDNTIRILVTADDRDGSAGNGAEGTGIDGNNTDVEEFFINVSGTNDAPVITLPADPTFLEDSGSNSISGISIADSDDFGDDLTVTLELLGTVKGGFSFGATTGVVFSTGDGSNDTTATFAGSKADINTMLATLTFTPSGDQNTVAVTQALQITVNDGGSTGAGGAQQDIETLNITITPVNDAPVRTAPSVALPAVLEDSAAPAGDAVSDLFNPVFNDSADTVTDGSSANTLAGVAVVGNAATAGEGVWQYNTGSGWTAIPTGASLATPFILQASDDVRFLPNAEWNGAPGDLTVRLIDDSSGAVTTGAGADLSGAATGGTTAYSNAANAVTLGTSITAINDAPTSSGTATLAAINEDPTNPTGAAANTLISGSNYDDSTDTVTGGSTATALGGIAIIGNAADPLTEGSWEYNTGSGWGTIPAAGLSTGSALVLPADADIRFVPIANYNGNPGSLTVHVADSVQAEGAGQDISGNLGGTETWSMGTTSIATTVNAVNDAPVVGGTGTTHSYIENDTAIVIEPALTLADDADDTELNQAVISLGASYVAGDTLAIDTVLASGFGITVDASTPGTLTLSGTATIAQYEQVLQSVTYVSSSDDPTGVDRTVTWQVRDVNSEGATNGQQLSNVGNTTIEVTPVNDAATVSNANEALDETDAALVFAGTLTSTDPDNPNNTFTPANIVRTNGSLVIDNTGAWTFAASSPFDSLNVGDSITETFNVTTIDGSPTTITVTINGTNDNPVSQSDTQFTDEETVLNTTVPLASDIDGTIDPTGFLLGIDVTEGDLTFNANGSYSFDPGSDFDDLPPGITRDVTFTYTATDNDGAVSDPVTVTITVTGTNDDPVAVADARAIDEETILNAIVPAASDVDGTIDPNGFLLAIDVTEGDLIFNPNGSYSFDPASDFDDLPPGITRDVTFTYTATDNDGGVSDPVTVTITVTGTNDDPVAVADAQTIDEETILNATVPAASDVDGTIDPNGFLLGIDVTEGDLTFNADGSYSFDPGSDFDDLPPGITRDVTFTYTATDNDSAVSAPVTVTITITGTNDAPIVNADAYTTDEDTPLTVPVITGVLANDSDFDTGDSLSVNITPVSDVANGTLVLNGDGSFSYTPDENYNGVDSFTYEVVDMNGGSTQATVTLTVTAINDQPLIENLDATSVSTYVEDAVPMVIDADITIGDVELDATNSWDQATLLIERAAGADANDIFSGLGDLSLDGGGDVILDGNVVGSYSQIAGSLLLTFNANATSDRVDAVVQSIGYSSTDQNPGTLITLAYQLNDNNSNNASGGIAGVGSDQGLGGRLIANGTIDINIEPVNDVALNFLPAPQTTTEDIPLVITGISVLNVDTTILTTTLSLPAGAGVLTVELGGGATITNNGTGSVVINGTATQINAALVSVLYNPAADFNTDISGPIAIEVVNTDDNEVDTSLLQLTVLAVVDIADDEATTDEDTLVTFNALDNDEFEGTPVVSIANQASNGVVALNPDGTFTYSPDLNYHGSDSFTYTVSVGGITETATVAITVLPVNDNPEANAENFEIDGGTASEGTVLNLLDNDSDLDGDTVLVSSIAGQPVIADIAQVLAVPNGEVQINAAGVITFYPDPSFTGVFSFDYELSDGNGGTATASVFVDVTPAARVDSGFEDYGTFRPEFTVPVRPVDPALHVLLSVRDSRNESQLNRGLNLLDTDSVTEKELLGGLDLGLGFASGDNGLGELGGKDFSPLGIDRFPVNSLYVQQAVRQIPLSTSHAVFVQLAVHQSQLESAARNAVVDSFNSAVPGVHTLLDAFAKPAKNQQTISLSDQHDVEKTELAAASVDDNQEFVFISDQLGMSDAEIMDEKPNGNAASFSDQLKASAATRLGHQTAQIAVQAKKSQV